jgi:hypothetical protein
MTLPKEQNSTEMEAAIQAFKNWRSTREKISKAGFERQEVNIISF